MSLIKKLKARRAEQGGEPQPAKPKKDLRVSKLQAKKLAQKASVLGVDLATSFDQSVVATIGPDGIQNLTASVPINKNLLQQYQAGLQTDVQRLSTKDTLEEKAAVKKELLPNYMPFVEDYMANGHDYPNSVAVMMMVWLFDIGDIEKGLHLGFYLVTTPKQTMPHGFSSTMETFICDYAYDWSIAQIKEEKTASPYLDNLVKVMLDAKWELALAVKSKMLSAIAKNCFLKQDFKACVTWCDAVKELNPDKHGTKGLRENALKEIEKLEQAKAEKE